MRLQNKEKCSNVGRGRPGKKRQIKAALPHAAGIAIKNIKIIFVDLSIYCN
jgi:hypothetical protein